MSPGGVVKKETSEYCKDQPKGQVSLNALFTGLPWQKCGLKSCESIIQRSSRTVSMNRWEPIWMAFDRLMNPGCSNASMAVNRSSRRCSDNGDALFPMAAREH